MNDVSKPQIPKLRMPRDDREAIGSMLSDSGEPIFPIDLVKVYGLSIRNALRLKVALDTQGGSEPAEMEHNSRTGSGEPFNLTEIGRRILETVQPTRLESFLGHLALIEA